MNRIPYSSNLPAQSSNAPKVFGEGRVCSYPSCKTRLSRYNANLFCYLHAPSERPLRRGS